mmetsp:Transcript_63409/g.127336  ORF Transcript_63409/g.127336 Transcript_63409/m.127336 type:complete len:157 (+) Transcript_63409:186-656(+)
MCIPPVEDGNNFGVAIVMEGIKIISDLKKELLETLKGLPEYHKERAGATEKLSPKVSTSSSESSSSSSDTEKKAAEDASDTKKSGTSSSQKKDSSSSSTVPDAVKHLVALDVSWHLRVYSICAKINGAYAVVGDFLDKNDRRIEMPRGSGGGMSMF